MEDDLGIVYLIENAQQFWSEIDDILHIPGDNSVTLSRLDNTLKRFLSVCTTYHEQYLQSPLQLEHACGLLFDSELFTFHSERMCEILSDEAQSNTDPHSQLMLYNVLLHHGRRHPNFFRSHKRWQPLLPLLMDHILVEIDPEIEDTYLGMTSAGGSSSSVTLTVVPIPIEAKLRSLSVRLVYEVCRVQKLSMQDLRIFNDAFLDHLFDLVEQTRNMHNETFNYSVIKLIVSLNEQFMVASLKLDSSAPTVENSDPTKPVEGQNRILNVLMRRLGSSQTFGENMIFMLNRAHRTAEDLCMQLLILKILYLLFSTKGTSEYFYTNDLCVLVDVFLRELVDLDEESESLRHTYLRVLHPLLTKTQLRSVPYKRPQIVRALESLVDNANIRDINPTTKRLVERCLSGEWCVQLRKSDNSHVGANRDRFEGDGTRVHSPDSDFVTMSPQSQYLPSSSSSPLPSSHTPPSAGMTTSLFAEQTLQIPQGKTLKPSRSVELLNAKTGMKSTSPRHLDAIRRPSNDSTGSLTGVAIAAMTSHRPKRSIKLAPAAITTTTTATATTTTTTTTTNAPLPIVNTCPPTPASPQSYSSAYSHTRSDGSGTKPKPKLKSRPQPPVPPPRPSSVKSLPQTPAIRADSVGAAFEDAGHLHVHVHHATPSSLPSSPSLGHKKAAPPTPPKRRKPPAVPVSGGRTNGGATITTIATSAAG